MLRQSVNLAFIDTGKQVGILIHVFSGSLQLLVGFIQSSLILLQFHFSLLQLSFQYGFLLVVFLLSFTLTNRYEIFLLLLKFISIA